MGIEKRSVDATCAADMWPVYRSAAARDMDVASLCSARCQFIPRDYLTGDTASAMVAVAPLLW